MPVATHAQSEWHVLTRLAGQRWASSVIPGSTPANSRDNAHVPRRRCALRRVGPNEASTRRL